MSLVCEEELQKCKSMLNVHTSVNQSNESNESNESNQVLFCILPRVHIKAHLDNLDRIKSVFPADVNILAVYDELAALSKLAAIPTKTRTLASFSKWCSNPANGIIDETLSAFKLYKMYILLPKIKRVLGGLDASQVGGGIIKFVWTITGLALVTTLLLYVVMGLGLLIELPYKLFKRKDTKPILIELANASPTAHTKFAMNVLLAGLGGVVSFTGDNDYQHIITNMTKL
jgi:hypothetical protein